MSSPARILVVGQRTLGSLMRLMAQRAGEIDLRVAGVEKPEELNVIVGQAHFIKTVENLHEALAGAVPQLRFGIAFCEALGPRLVGLGRRDHLREASESCPRVAHGRLRTTERALLLTRSLQASHDSRLPRHPHRAARRPFDMILCRNLVFTYFDGEHQLTVGAGLADRLGPGGALVLGAHEQLPVDLRCLEPWDAARGVYRRPPDPTGDRAAASPV